MACTIKSLSLLVQVSALLGIVFPFTISNVSIHSLDSTNVRIYAGRLHSFTFELKNCLRSILNDKSFVEAKTRTIIVQTYDGSEIYSSHFTEADITHGQWIVSEPFRPDDNEPFGECPRDYLCGHNPFSAYTCPFRDILATLEHGWTCEKEVEGMERAIFPRKWEEEEGGILPGSFVGFGEMLRRYLKGGNDAAHTDMDDVECGLWRICCY